MARLYCSPRSISRSSRSRWVSNATRVICHYRAGLDGLDGRRRRLEEFEQAARAALHRHLLDLRQQIQLQRRIDAADVGAFRKFERWPEILDGGARPVTAAGGRSLGR